MKKRIAFILVCLLSLCMLPTMAEAAAISARVVKIDQYGHAQLSLAKADFAGAGFDLGDIVKVTCGSYIGDMPVFDGFYVDREKWALILPPGNLRRSS